MSEEFKVEIVNPEKSFLSKDDVTEVVVPAFEGEIGILKDHISIISFLKPGIIKIFSKSDEKKYFVEDGVVEFYENKLTILSSNIKRFKEITKDYISLVSEKTTNRLKEKNIDDKEKYILDYKMDILNNLNI